MPTQFLKRIVAEEHHVILRAPTFFSSFNFSELYRYRELLYFFIWRDLKVRYKQTVLGAAWAILQPAATMAIFSIFFGHFGKMPSDGIAYPLFSLAALVPWTLFVQAVQQASNSLVAESHLIKKVYFPRILLPLSGVLSGVVDFLFAFAALVGLMLIYQSPPSANILYLPLLILWVCFTAFGVGLCLATLNVKYRDVRYALPFCLQLWMLATPIAYPCSLLPEKLRFLYALNPAVGIVEAFRWALLGTPFQETLYVISLLTSAVFFLIGIFYFQSMERSFADVV
jgi:lipopolysaccharide transport system permease protein